MITSKNKSEVDFNTTKGDLLTLLKNFGSYQNDYHSKRLRDLKEKARLALKAFNEFKRGCKEYQRLKRLSENAEEAASDLDSKESGLAQNMARHARNRIYAKGVTKETIQLVYDLLEAFDPRENL